MAKQDDLGIRGIYNPSDDEKDKIRFVYDRKRDMEESDDRTKALKVWDKAEKQYETWRNDRPKSQWQSNHVVPMTFSVIETALSEMVTQSFRPLILPRGKEDTAKATVMQYIWDYTWEISDGDVSVYNILKDSLMFGTGIGQEYYRQDRRTVTQSKVGKNNKEEEEEKEVIDYEDCFLENVKLQDFYVDEKARGFTGPYGARDCIRRYIMNIEDFKLFFKGETWDQFGNVKYVRPGGDTNFYEFYKPPTGISNEKEVEVLWYWGVKPADRLRIVANDVLIRDGANPYKHKQLPFVRCLDVKRPHRFYGKGEAEILESIHDEATTLRRMVIDRNHLDIDKMFIVSRGTALSDEDLIARPHGMIQSDDVNVTKPVEYGDIPRSVELGYKWLEDDGTIATGINPRAQALPQSGTATEAAILKESTLRRINMKIWLMKKEFLIQLARLRVANILQFYPQPKLEKIVGSQNEAMYKDQMSQLESRGLTADIEGEKYVKQYRQIRLEDEQLDINDSGEPTASPASGFTFFELRPDYFVPASRGGYDIKFDASSNVEISKPLMQSKILELFDRFAQIALQAPGSYDLVKLGDMVLKAYDKDPNDLKPDEVVQQNSQATLLDNQVQLATMENSQMINGNPMPATPYASPVHTRVHLEFMQSPQFQQSEDPTVDQIFTQHVMGEIGAQGMREQQGAPGAVTPPPQAPPGAPQGQVNQGGISQGVTNKPNGMKSTKTKVGDVMPSLNTGGNKNLP